MPDVPLRMRVGGSDFSAWESFSLTRSVITCCVAFSMQLANRRRVTVRPDDRVELWFGERKVLDGYLDALDQDAEKEDHGVTVVGRDKTADLVDCSVYPWRFINTSPVTGQPNAQKSDRKPNEWHNQSVGSLARELAKPYGVKVVVEHDPLPIFERISVDEGDGVFEALAKMARMRGVLLYGTGDGALLVTKPNPLRVAGVRLVEGVNVKAAKMHWSTDERFAKYVVRGQKSGSDAEFGAAVAQVEGVADDAETAARRPLRVKRLVAEKQVTRQVATQRAQYEASIRAAKSQRVEVTTAGWEYVGADGKRRVFDLNQTFAVDLKTFRVTGDLFVEGLRFSASRDSGRETRLTLTRTDAYQVQPDLKPDANVYLEYLKQDPEPTKPAFPRDPFGDGR